MSIRQWEPNIGLKALARQREQTEIELTQRLYEVIDSAKRKALPKLRGTLKPETLVGIPPYA